MIAKKNDDGIKVEEHHVDLSRLDEGGKSLIDTLNKLQTIHGFNYHVEHQKEKGHFFVFTNIPVNNINLALEYDGRVHIGAGVLGSKPIFHKLRHRVTSIETRLEHMLIGLIGRPNAFGYKMLRAVRSRPKPT